MYSPVPSSLPKLHPTATLASEPSLSPGHEASRWEARGLRPEGEQVQPGSEQPWKPTPGHSSPGRGGTKPSTPMRPMPALAPQPGSLAQGTLKWQHHSRVAWPGWSRAPLLSVPSGLPGAERWHKSDRRARGSGRECLFFLRGADSFVGPQDLRSLGAEPGRQNHLGRGAGAHRTGRRKVW